MSEWTWSGLSPKRADGLVCVICGRSFLRTGSVFVPVGRSRTGSQVFACADRCAERAWELAHAFLTQAVIPAPVGSSPPEVGVAFANAVGVCRAELEAALRWDAAGSHGCLAAVELLIAHGCWLVREVVLERIRWWPRDEDGPAQAAPDWVAISAVLDAGELRASASERFVLAVAVSLAGAREVSLAGLSSCDRVTVRLIAQAIGVAGGTR
jgi:hypothetical protein